MNDFRQSLLTLPFVAQKDDGRLDYWSVATTGDRATDLEIGRNYGARWLHFCRDFEAPHLAHHLFEAWVESAPRCQGHIREGFVAECVRAMIEAPRDATPNLSIARLQAGPGTWLPFCAEDPHGSLIAWSVEPSGDRSRDTAAGRYYGALTVQEVRARRDAGFLWQVAEGMARSPRYEEERGLRIGWATEIAQIQMAAPRDCTSHQAAALPLHEAALRAA